MIGFLKSTIVHSLHEPDSTVPESTSRIPPSPTAPESDGELADKFFFHSNSVAHTRQLHSKRHTATCFKYTRRGSDSSSCRFGMPRDSLERSRVDEYGIVHLERNNAWVNPWNPAVASCIRSNHDISWIPTVSKSLSLLDYITNYATKDDVSPGQIVAKAALLKQSIERASSTSAPCPADMRLRERGMDKFALRCFNSLSQDREIVTIFSKHDKLLQVAFFVFPPIHVKCYTVDRNFVMQNETSQIRISNLEGIGCLTGPGHHCRTN